MNCAAGRFLVKQVKALFFVGLVVRIRICRSHKAETSLLLLFFFWTGDQNMKVRYRSYWKTKTLTVDNLMNSFVSATFHTRATCQSK